MDTKDFFTMTSISSLAVAASAVNVTANALYRFAKVDPKRSAFITGLLIGYLNVVVSRNFHWAEWLIAFINGCLLFCTAMGMNDLLEQPRPARTRKLLPGSMNAPPPFFVPWRKQER
jgi:hypothetical protein